MRFILSVVIICCLAFVSIAAETEPEDWQNNKPVARDNAFLFQTGSNLLIASYSGFLFAGRHHFSTTQALELRFGFDGRIYDDEWIDESFDDTLIVRESVRDSYDRIVRISAVYLMYFDRQSNLMPFWGIGPTFQYQYSDLENYDLYNSRTLESKYIDVGMVGDIGFEWFLLPRLSLVASYKMKFVYRWGTDINERWDNDEFDRETSKTRSFNLGYERTDLGVVLYF
ncbi:hypothetical protein K9N50_04405 [bacterium]|nr:hypothetical protein [bacterium]